MAWIDQAFGKYYVPVSVVPENVAASAPRPPLMVFRSSLDIELLRWRIRREGGGASVGEYIRVGGESPAIRAGQAVSLEIRGQPSGPTIVDVVVKYANIEQPESQLFRIILP